MRSHIYTGDLVLSGGGKSEGSLENMRCPWAPSEIQKRKKRKSRALTLGDLLQPQDVLRGDHGAGQQVLLRGHRDTHACRAATFPDPHRRRLRLAAVCSSAVSSWLMSGSSLSTGRLLAAASAGTRIAHSPPPPLSGYENPSSPPPLLKDARSLSVIRRLIQIRFVFEPAVCYLIPDSSFSPGSHASGTPPG